MSEISETFVQLLQEEGFTKENAQRVMHYLPMSRVLSVWYDDTDGFMTIIVINCFFEKYIKMQLKEKMGQTKWNKEANQNYSSLLHKVKRYDICSIEEYEVFRAIDTLRCEVAHDIDSYLNFNEHYKQVERIVGLLKVAYGEEKVAEWTERASHMKKENSSNNDVFHSLAILCQYTIDYSRRMDRTPEILNKKPPQ